MTSLCGRCNDPLPGDEELDASCCSVCEKRYHFECNTVGEVSWRTYGPKRRGDWVCSTCNPKKAPKLTPNTRAQVRSGDEEENEFDEDRVTKLLERVLDSKLAELESSMNKKFGELQTTLTFYGETLGDMAKTVKNLEQNNILLEKKLATQEAVNKELGTRVRKLEVMVHQREQIDISTKLEVTGFKNVDVEEKSFVEELLEKTGHSAQGTVRYNVQKISKPNKDNKNEKNISLIIQFTTEEMRSSVLTKIKELKIYNKMNIIVQGKCSKLGFNELLTPYYKELFYQAKRVAVDKKFSYLWIKNGKILLKKKEDSKIDTLTCMDDLGKL